jgi:oligoendopeptidase F
MLEVTHDDSEIKAALNKAETKSTEMFNVLKFFQISLGKIPTERQEVIMMDSRLQKYHFFLSEIFAVSHYQLSEKEEQLLSTVS